MHLARALGLEGTPTLVVGHAVVFGGMGPDSLRALLRAARSR
jgi:protein-disulfide isomerase